MHWSNTLYFNSVTVDGISNCLCDEHLENKYPFTVVNWHKNVASSSEEHLLNALLPIDETDDGTDNFVIDVHPSNA